MNIKTVGLGSGLIMAQLGNSHFGIEDASDDVPRVKLDIDQPGRGNLTVLWESRE